MAIRAILIDLDGVVRLWDARYDAGVMEAAHIPIETIDRIAFASDLLPEAVTGRMSDEEWRDEIVARLALIHPTLDARAAVAAWSRPIGQVNELVRALTDVWRGRVAVALVSNATTRLPADLTALGLMETFDVVVNSSAIGIAKPDPAIFRYALEQVGVLPDEALFIDDTASHILVARELGLETFHFTGDVDRLRDVVTDRLDRP